MSDPGRTGHVLSGLVSPPAAELYTRLLVNGFLRLGTGRGELDVHASTIAELLDADVAFRSGPDDSLVRPVSPATALRTLLELRHRELGDLQQRLRDGWQRLEGQLPSILGGGTGDAGHGLEVITDGPRISTMAAGLYRSAKEQFRGTETGDFPTRPTASRGFTPPPAAIAAGVRYRYVYKAVVNGTRWGQQIIRQSVEAGEEVRLRRSLPVKLMQVDTRAALVSVDRPGNVAVLVTAPTILEMISEWFDLIWDDRLTTLVDGARPTDLKPGQLEVLQLLPTAESDAEIAKSLRMSVTTVRRHVRAIYEALGVNTRFAAGAAAVRRGWI